MTEICYMCKKPFDDFLDHMKTDHNIEPDLSEQWTIK